MISYEILDQPKAQCLLHYILHGFWSEGLPYILCLNVLEKSESYEAPSKIQVPEQWMVQIFRRVDNWGLEAIS